MSAALLVLGYAVVLGWCVPGPLTRLTASGISARLGLAAWIAAMTSVLTCLVSAVLLLVKAAIVGWPGLAEAVCRSVTGRACAASLYRSAVFEIALGLAAIIAAAAASVAVWRYGLAMRRAQRRTRAHGQAARITGRRIPGIHGGGQAVVLDDSQPAAYCVPGRPATIVLTSGALAVLDPAQLAAVLAHERAHLAGRHHLMLGLTRGLAVSFPGVPVFTRGPAEVGRLAEMCADDAAARRTGRRALLAALLTMGTGQAVPVTAMAVTAGAVAGRVQRLLEPPRHARRARNGAALIIVTTMLALATGLIVAFAGPLAAHVISLA